MFSTKQDLELKSRRSSGPPFFDLRESISRILYEHIKDPKVPQEVNFFIINYMVGSVSGEGRILCCYWPPKRERLATQAIKKKKRNLYCSSKIAGCWPHFFLPHRLVSEINTFELKLGIKALMLLLFATTFKTPTFYRFFLCTFLTL